MKLVYNYVNGSTISTLIGLNLNRLLYIFLLLCTISIQSHAFFEGDYLYPAEKGVPVIYDGEYFYFYCKPCVKGQIFSIYVSQDNTTDDFIVDETYTNGWIRMIYLDNLHKI